MRVHALVRDRVIIIDCGEGYQRVKWLAMVATQRYDDLLAVTDGGYGGVGKKHVPVGLEDEAGRRLPPTKTVNRLPAAVAAVDGVVLQPGYEPRVRVLLLDDAPSAHKSGTSSFLTAIAAVPDMCLVTGPGLVSCAPRRHATFTVYCRDNFSIPISNGGEDLSVTFTNDSGVALRADVNDHADGQQHPCLASLASPLLSRACCRLEHAASRGLLAAPALRSLLSASRQQPRHRARAHAHPTPVPAPKRAARARVQAPTLWCTSCRSEAPTRSTSR